MRLERGNLVRITDDEVKIAKYKEEGYKEVEEVNEEKADKEAKEAETAEEKAEEKKVEEAETKKTTGRGRSRANNKK